MVEVKNHICAGANCIFCQIAADEQANKQATQLAGELSLDSSRLIGQPEYSKEEEKQIELSEKLAFYDQLTGLFNIHVLLRELQDEFARADRYKRPLSVLALCIDNYEEIKAKHGRVGCELVLKHIGKLLPALLREVDIAARLQADQFVIILPETNEAGAHVVAERIRQALIKKPAKLNALVFEITPSMGLVMYPKHGLDLNTLLDNCFAAQAQALSRGGNRIHAL